MNSVIEVNRDSGYDDMVRVLSKPGNDILKSLTPDRCHILHMAFGLASEILEFDEAIYAFSVTESYNYEQQITHILEELGDIEFYLTGLCQAYHITFTLNENDYNGVVHPALDVLMAQIKRRGEQIITLVKKDIIYQKNIELEEETLEKTIIAFRTLIAKLCANPRFKISANHIRNANTAKLGKRYEKFRYSDRSAIDRADKVEESK